VRPALQIREYRDANGDLIPYGDRWPDSPPDEAYSIVTDADRYEPLHVVALALEAWLSENYEVVPMTTDTPVEPRQEPGWALSELTLAPAESAQAPLTIALTSFPGVHLRAGLTFGAAFPSCGCDACDEDIIDQIEELEETVFAIVGGRFSEVVSDAGVRTSLEAPGWSRSSFIPHTLGDPALPSAPTTWRPWTTR
jgi:hypothetical protein